MGSVFCVSPCNTVASPVEIVLHYHCLNSIVMLASRKTLALVRRSSHTIQRIFLGQLWWNVSMEINLEIFSFTHDVILTQKKKPGNDAEVHCCSLDWYHTTLSYLTNSYYCEMTLLKAMCVPAPFSLGGVPLTVPLSVHLGLALFTVGKNSL